MNYKELNDLIYNYPTKYPQGFIKSEISEILSKLKINEDKFNKALGYGFTCMCSPDGETIIYHRDVELAITLVKENRLATDVEWD